MGTTRRRLIAALGAGALALTMSACYLPSGGGAPEQLVCLGDDPGGIAEAPNLAIGDDGPMASCNDSIALIDVDYYRLAVLVQPEGGAISGTAQIACGSVVGSGATWSVVNISPSGARSVLASGTCPEVTGVSLGPDIDLGLGDNLVRVVHPPSSGEVVIHSFLEVHGTV